MSDNVSYVDLKPLKVHILFQIFIRTMFRLKRKVLPDLKYVLLNFLNGKVAGNKVCKKNGCPGIMVGMNTTIQSLTQRCLFHPWVLDHILSPSDRQIYRISSTGNSVLEVLRQVAKDPCSSPKNRSYAYKADKYFLLTPFKVAYIALTTLFISRIGILLNASLTVYSYIRYSFSLKDNIDPFWEKTEQYARACFNDVVCAALGAVLAKIAVEGTLIVLHFARLSPILGKCCTPFSQSAQILGTTALVLILASASLIAFQDPEYAPQIFANSEARVSMYLALSLRKSLGLAGKNGGLLPYSEKDKLEYTENPLKFSGENYDTLFQLYFNAELRLIEIVKKCNELLPPNRQIPFSYPLNGQIIADSLESVQVLSGNQQQALVGKNDTSLNVLAEKLRDQQFIIKFLRKIFEQAEELTFNDPVLVLLLKEALTFPTTKLVIPNVLSYIPEVDYRSYYESYKIKSASDKFSWDSLDIKPVDPNSEKRPANDALREFKYDVAVIKWLIQHKTPADKSERELIGLTKNSTYKQFCEAKRKYLLAIHPDKNNEDKESVELAKVLMFILDKVRNEYNIEQ